MILEFKAGGNISTSCPTAKEPSTSVPVTTVPEPEIVKTRSIGNLGLPISRLGRAVFRTFSMISFNSSKPCPVTAETETTGAPAKRVGRIKSSISMPTNVIWSLSTRSDWVITTIACGTSIKSRMARCSRVCGLMDSLAATTSKAKSMPLTPASIFLIKCS